MKMLSICTILFLTISNVVSVAVPSFTTSLESFSHDIFNELVQSKDGENIIYSPFSIQTCLAMVRMGAGGQTAAELDRGLGFTGQTAESVADNYFDLLSKYEHSDIVQTANKIYLMQDYELQDEYKEVVSQKFFSSVENIDFSQKEEAAETINSWVEEKTHNLIKNLIDPSSLGGDKRFVLLSAIYFKGEWEQRFSGSKVGDFHNDETNRSKVEIMHKREVMPYGSFPDLDAQVIRMYYKNSDLSMWIFLPNADNGLSSLEKKLTNVQLESLAKKMDAYIVSLSLPKFKVNYTINLTETLKKMGMTTMFHTADFSKMLKSPEPLAISSVIHKAFIEVDEAGTEASAATAMLGYARIGGPPMTFFNVYHPFYYVIANNDFVPLFQGTVVNL